DRPDAGPRREGVCGRGRDREAPDRRARDARGQDQGQPRRSRRQASREPAVRPARRVCRCATEAMMRVLLVLALLGCREREPGLDARAAATAAAAATTRILYPSAPGSFV